MAYVVHGIFKFEKEVLDIIGATYAIAQSEAMNSRHVIENEEKSKQSHGDSFGIGNLKHKDLQGREVNSQLHMSEDEKDGSLNGQNEVVEYGENDDD